VIAFRLDEPNPETIILTLTGSLDSHGVREVETPVTAILAGSGAHALLDLEELEFIGSLGLRLLLTNARLLERRGRRMVIFGVQPAVAEVFETVSLATLIRVVDDEAAALAALAD
jgi:anti-anti-sigma factor